MKRNLKSETGNLRAETGKLNTRAIALRNKMGYSSV